MEELAGLVIARSAQLQLRVKALRARFDRYFEIIVVSFTVLPGDWSK